jgi:MoaA/NifB/PqqE/SkfB family radical SAM enzyme
MIPQDQVLRQLPVLVLHVNNRCNCRCVMCSIWKSTDESELTPQTLRNLLPDMRALGVVNVVFTGGEPLMHSALPDLGAILREAGIRITILTTGLLLARLAACVSRMADDVIVSLDGPREIHDRIRRVVGGYDLLSDGVKALHAVAPDFAVSGRCTVQKANYASLRQTVDAAHGVGLQSISFLAADLTSTAFNRTSPLSVIEMSPLALTHDEVQALECEIGELVRERSADFASGFIAESPDKMRRIPHHFRAHLGLENPVAPRCNAPWISAVLETDGALRPCFFHRPIGNALADGLAGALNGPDAVGFRSQLRIADDPVCRRCVCSLYRPVG